MSTSLWANLCALTHIEPDSPGALDAVHAAVDQVVGRGTIQRIREGTPPRVATLDKLAARLRVTPSQLLGATPATNERSATSLAHEVSQASSMVPPQTLVWEDLVRDQIKGLFVLAIKGDALVPNYLPGQTGIWQAGPDARAGQPVLIWLPGDRFEPRIYEDRGATWAGVALKPGHRTLTPEEDGATVVARLKYLDLD